MARMNEGSNIQSDRHQQQQGEKPKKFLKFFNKNSDPVEKTQKKRVKVLVPKDENLKKPKFAGNVLLTNPKTYIKDSTLKRILDVIIDTFYEFAGITKVNGMYYLRRFVTHGFQRFLWSCIMLSLFSFAITLVFLLYRRFLQSPTIVTIDAPIPIHDIPFPAVTICHPQNVMEYKSKEFLERAKLPLGLTREYAMKILPLLGGFTERFWIEPRTEDLELIDQFLVANNMTVEDAIDRLGTVCNDFILVCVFAGKSFPCFQEHPFMTFVESYSYLGSCCSFNYHPKMTDGSEVFKSNFFGINGGLTIIGTGRPQASDGRSGAIYSEGFVIIVHHPNDFAVEKAPTTFANLKKETFVDVTPIYSLCTDQVLALDFDRRKCIIPSDLNSDHYRQPECMLNCLRDHIYTHCNCHPFNLPRESNSSKFIRDCIATDVACFSEHYFEFKQIVCSHCYPSCTDVVYKTTSFKMNLDKIENSIDSLYTQINITNMEFIVRVFYGGQTVQVNKKIIAMSWISLLSNLGGSFSLCLGMSILSICEIFYFIFVRMVKHYKRIFRVGPVIPKFRNYPQKY
ncbi:hypothetical protein PVAND_013132 [Polypedilum vanderplanki]|uniref:Uncharacterized protein n=1 Tax=Polypedilum vanderplanki TaxID=319348 RepID=A0A9J6CPR7_POLVA|nr:hypothetical protein PVAND_013132 [Polypedilum vanderplanki]